ncbi:MAG: HAMP domain-containing sensor histidine kinase, partial [Clostridia bacterium]
LSQVSVMAYFLSLIILGICCYIMSVNAIRPLKDAYFKQRQLIADASHEIKTPITVVSANLELIASDPTASVESNKRWIDSSQYQIKRMSSLILQMLELSSIEEGKYFKNYEKINVSQICFGVVLSFEAVAFEKNIDIKSDIQDGLIAKGNSIEFEKLVTTLLDNALKYTNSNGIITFELRKEGKKIVMSVVNTGEGISSEKIPYLFERFYKMDNAHQESGNSFGLGLSIAKTIAVNMKGDIECTSEVGKWTKFEVVLPYEREKARAKKQINSDEV